LNAFAHTVAHDLKTPIAALSMGIDLLARVENGKLSQQGLEILQSAATTSQRMATITDELLLLASVRDKAIETRPLQMADIFANTESRLQMMISEYQVALFKPEQWPVAVGYAPWIEEVWANYLSNAIKYGGCPTQVWVGGDELTDGRIQFWVQDNGDGLTQDEMRQIFQPFQRLSQVETQGYGLGLPIVQRVLEKLGGEVGVESSGIAGRGCKFSFTLPAAE
jgi:signal transduction histidine kinase